MRHAGRTNHEEEMFPCDETNPLSERYSILGDTVNVFYCIAGKTLNHVMGRMPSQNAARAGLARPEMRW